MTRTGCLGVALDIGFVTCYMSALSKYARLHRPNCLRHAGLALLGLDYRWAKWVGWVFSAFLYLTCVLLTWSATLLLRPLLASRAPNAARRTRFIE